MNYRSENNTISIFAAKTHLSELLEKVQSGLSFTITKHSHPIANLIPAVNQKNQSVIKETIAEIKAFRKNFKLNASEVQNWKQEGRK
jgi:prevent-host-death family protein